MQVVPRDNHGVFFFSWYDQLQIKLNSQEWHEGLRELLVSGDNQERSQNLESLSWPDIFGTQLENVKHIIFDGRAVGDDRTNPFLRWCSHRMEFLKSSVHYVPRFTLHQHRVNEAYYEPTCGSSRTLWARPILTLGKGKAKVQFVNSIFHFAVGLYGIWNAQWMPAFAANYLLPCIEVKGSKFWVGMPGGLPDWYEAWFRRWIYESIRDNDYLWSYPPAQLNWLRQCLNMVPVCDDPFVVGGRRNLEDELKKGQNW